MLLSSVDSPELHPLMKHHPVWSRALEALHELHADSPVGITELEGDKFFVNVHGYDTVPEEEAKWENHLHTIDIQIALRGGECVDWVPLPELTPLGNYDPAKDKENFKLEGDASRVSRLRMTPGRFAIFLPGDAHRPKVADGVHASIHKAVVKIDTSLLQDWLS